MLREASPVGPGSLLLDRYQVEQALGEGGSGIVYRAWDRILSEPVAIKLLHPERARDRSWIKRLAREVKVARAIRHPNVCRVFELGRSTQAWFVTMELATGGSLRDSLRAEASAKEASARNLRPLPERLRDIHEVVAGLGAIHAVGIVHRDVTPQNVLRMADGRLVLTDFGLAIEHGAETTVQGGTPAYLPPEVARGERSDQRSDVFQLGMIMHEILTGKRATWSADGTRLQTMDPRAGATAVEEALCHLIEECVSAERTRRPASALTVAGRLAAAEVARPAMLPVRLMRRARRYARLNPRVVQAGLVAGAVALVAGVLQIAMRPPLCQGAEQQMAGTWDPPRAEAVRRAFVGTGKSHASDTFARVRTILDHYARGWKDMYTDACQATSIRGEQSAEVLDLRMSCLKSQQGELRALTDLFSAADGETVSRAINAASALSPVVRCADVTLLREVVRLPADRLSRDRIEELRQRVAEVKALADSGRFAEGERRGKALVDDARNAGYGPVLAEALMYLGIVETWSGPLPGAEAALDEAMLQAEASRHDRVLAESAVWKAGMLGHEGRLEDLERFVPRAEATVRRIGGDPQLESWIYNSRGAAYNDRKKYVQALAMHERALAIKQRFLGPEHWDVALSLGNVASELHALGRNDEALERNQQAIAILERAFGSRHPDLGTHVYNRGEIRLALGQTAAARLDFQRALEIWRDELPPTHAYFGFAWNGLGLASLAEEHPAEAIAPLERALVVRRAHAESPDETAETMFALARALWLSGRDPARARTLATQSRDLFGPTRASDQRRVDGTLAAWGSPPRDAATSRAKPGAGVRAVRTARAPSPSL